MTDIAELGHDPVSAGESEAEVCSPPVDQQIQKRKKTRRLRFDEKSIDRYMRVIVAFTPTPDPTRDVGEEHKEISKENDDNVPGLADLVHVHLIGSAVFGENRQDARKILQQMVSHPALQPLDEAAQFVASVYIFQAYSAYRLKTDGKYWVLGDIGEAHPLAVGYPHWYVSELEESDPFFGKAPGEAANERRPGASAGGRYDHRQPSRTDARRADF